MPGLLGFVVTRYLPVLGLYLAALIVGRRVTRDLAYHNWADRLGFSVAAGLAMVGTSCFLLAAVGGLRREVLVAIAGLALLLLRRTVTTTWHELRSALELARSNRRVTVITLVLVGLVVLPLLLLPLYPPTHWDSTMYHLPFARAMAEEHRLAHLPNLKVPAFPLLGEVLFTAPMVFAGDTSAQALHAAALLVTCLLALGWSARWSSWRAGTWAALICLGSPLVLWVATGAHVDAFVMAFAAGSVYAFVRWQEEEGDLRWLALAGLLAGAASGTKYLGLVVVALLAALIVVGRHPRKALLPAAVFLAGAATVVGPVYGHVYLCTGNPVFPFLPGVFGLGPWSLEDYRGFASSMRDSFGTGHGWRALIALPWNLVARWEVFGDPVPLFLPTHLVLSPLLLLALGDGRFRVLYFLVAGYTAFWFLTSQVTRYLFPVFPLLAIMLCHSLDRFVTLAWPPGRSRLARGLLVLVVATVLVAPGHYFAFRLLTQRGIPPFTLEARDAYLTGRVPVYAAVKWLNDNGGQYVAYQLFAENAIYYFRGPVIGEWTGRAGYGVIQASAHCGQQLYETLRSLGVTHLVVATDRYHLPLPEDDPFFDSHFRLVFFSPPARVYEMVAVPDSEGRGR